MVARQNTKAARVIRNRFVKAELRRKIRDWFLDCAARAGLSISVRASQIFLKRVVDLIQFTQEILVLRNLFEPRLP